MRNVKIEAPELIKDIEDRKFLTKTKQVRKTTFNHRRQAAFQPLVEWMRKAVQHHYVAQANLKVMGTKATVSLETCVINLPFSSVRPLKRVVGSQKTMPVNVYVMIADPMVNRSKFRIDEIASADDFVKSTTDDLTRISNWLNQQIEQIHRNQKTAKSKPKKKTRRRKTKTTRRRKSTRRKRK